MINQLSTTFSIRIVCGVGVVLGAMSLTSAVPPVSTDPPPTTAPAAQVVVELDGPKAAMLAYNAGMRSQDAGAMTARQHATTADGKRLVRATVGADLWVGALLVETEKKWGKDARLAVGQAIEDMQDEQALAAEASIDGDAGTLTIVETGEEMRFVRVDGVWKFDVDHLVKQVGRQFEPFLIDLSRRGNLAKVLSQDLAAGRYQTADELVTTITKERARQRGQ